MSKFWAASSNGLLGGFQRVAAGPQFAAWPSLIGAEMMVNGDCGSATGWTDNGNPPGAVVVAAGVMTATLSLMLENNSGVAAAAMVEGATYRCVNTIGAVSVPAEGVRQRIGLGEGGELTAPGTYSEDIVATDVENEGGWAIASVSGAVTMTFDDFSIKSVGLLGVEADWTFTGDVGWSPGASIGPDAIRFDGSSIGDQAELTGSAMTAFDASVSNNTACSVTLTTSVNNPLDGTIRIAMKGGVPVSFVFFGTPGDTVTHTVTSGSGSGCVVSAGSDNPAGDLVRSEIDLA